jgi:plasmid maintenance system antidote protein VapI
MNLNMQAADAFRENVKSQIVERHMSISALARAAGIQQASMSKILSGNEAVTLQRADRIATALGKSLTELLEGSSVATASN